MVAGLAIDLPLSIMGPNYFCHAEDVDFIFPEMVGLEPEDE
jgi:hypothetical protein